MLNEGTYAYLDLGFVCNTFTDDSTSATDSDSTVSQNTPRKGWDSPSGRPANQVNEGF